MSDNDVSGGADAAVPGFRPIKAIPITGVEPNQVRTGKPEFRWVDPTTLRVEERYQRDLSEKSITLIRRIVANWSWDSFKPPVCAVGDDDALMVIDGQHTAIGAASHPDISEIPVMVVDAAELAARAMAFVRHNSDRIAMTGNQIYYAALAAGDEVAVAMDEACRRAGVTILRNPPSRGVFRVGDTMAVANLRSITERRGVNFTARMLRILMDAQRAPLSSAEIVAVTALLTEPEWKDSMDPADLAATIRSKPARSWVGHAESTVRKGLKMPMSRALAIAWFRATPKIRQVRNG
jgi:hypothetical protein